MTFEDTIELLEEFKEEGVPRNVKVDIDSIIVCLKDESLEKSLKINKTLSIIDDISNDVNLDSLVRTQFLNLSSILEGML